MTNERQLRILQAIGANGADVEQLRERVYGFDPAELNLLLDCGLVFPWETRPPDEANPIADEPELFFRLTPAGAEAAGIDPNDV
jgi:hypothetical protein